MESLITDNSALRPRHLGAVRQPPRTLYIAVYLVLAVLVFLPVAPWSNTSIPFGPLSGGAGSSDPIALNWFLEWFAYAVTHGHNIFFTNFVFSSKGTVLFPYTSVPLLGALAVPVTLKLGPIAAYNILIRLALAGSAISTFLMLSSWCRRPFAFMGGLFFGFGPYLMMQSENHLNLAFLVLLPPITWCAAEIVVVRRGSPWLLGAALGLAAALQVFVSVEMVTLLGLVLLLGFIGFVVIHRAHLIELVGFWVRGLGMAAFVFTALTAYFFFNFFFGSGHLSGPILPSAILQFFHADLLGPIIPTANLAVTSTKLSYLSYRFVGGNITENGAYLGLPLVATLTYLALRFRHCAKITGPFVLAFVAWLLSLGDRLTIAGRESHVPLPEALFAHLPLLNNVVPARFGAIVALFAAIALALGMQVLVDTRRAVGPGLSAPSWVMAAVGMSIVLSLVPSVPVTREILNTPPTLLNQLTVVPRGAEVLTYPFPTASSAQPMIWQIQDHLRFRLLGGYIRATPPPVLSPAFVQTFFYQALFGSLQSLPRGLELQRDAVLLRDFLRINHVGAVVFWNVGLESSVVRHLLNYTLGRPERTIGNDYAIWLTGPRDLQPRFQR